LPTSRNTSRLLPFKKEKEKCMMQNPLECEYEDLIKNITIIMAGPLYTQKSQYILYKYKEFYMNHLASKQEYFDNAKYNWINVKDFAWWICSIPCLISYLYQITFGYKKFLKQKLSKKFLLSIRIRYENTFNFLDKEIHNKNVY
jgi:hypothetical protein